MKGIIQFVKYLLEFFVLSLRSRLSMQLKGHKLTCTNSMSSSKKQMPRRFLFLPKRRIIKIMILTQDSLAIIMGFLRTRPPEARMDV